MSKLNIILLLVLTLAGCVTSDDRQRNLISDPSYGLVVLKAANGPYASYARVLVENIDTGDIITFNKIFTGGSPVVYRLKPGTYRLYQFRKYINRNPSLSYIKFKFTVKKNLINYVGDWNFIEVKKGGGFSIKFTVSHSRDTVLQAIELFPHIFREWKSRAIDTNHHLTQD